MKFVSPPAVIWAAIALVSLAGRIDFGVFVTAYMIAVVSVFVPLGFVLYFGAKFAGECSTRLRHFALFFVAWVVASVVVAVVGGWLTEAIFPVIVPDGP